MTDSEVTNSGVTDAQTASQISSYRAEIKVMLKRAILDPQGRAVETTLHRLGTKNVTDVRIGKHIELTLEGERAEVDAQLGRLIEDILSNPVTEEAHYTLAENPTEREPEAGVPEHPAE